MEGKPAPTPAVGGTKLRYPLTRRAVKGAPGPCGISRLRQGNGDGMRGPGDRRRKRGTMRPLRGRFTLVGIAALVAGSLAATVLLLHFGPGVARGGQAAQAACAPTAPDDEGPFYKPNAPERAGIGSGLVLSGVVRAAGDCAPIPKARLEWWQANPQGRYDDAHRAVQTADAEGRYRFETSFPVAYYGRPPHIHVKVQAPGHAPLTTQLYPKAGQTEIAFDFVLRPR